MPNTKKETFIYQTGLILWAEVTREADEYQLNDADGSFASAPADPYIGLAEHATIKGRYPFSDNRSAWDDGYYTISVHEQIGASPSRTDDALIIADIFYIQSDQIISELGGIIALPGNIIGNLNTAGVLQSLIPTQGDPIRIMRGDAARLSFSFGSQWDCSGGKKIYFCAKQNKADNNSTAIVNRACIITDAANAAGYIDLTATETAAVGGYHYEFERRDSDESNPRTIQQGQLIIQQDVRQ